MKKTIIVVAIAAASVAIFIACRAWLDNHDARIAAGVVTRIAEVDIKDLQAQVVVVQRQRDAEVQTLKADAAKVYTPAEAIAAVPEVSTLKVEALPEAPTKAVVEAVPLYQALNVCKQNEVSLDACGREIDLQKQITAEKDKEITALKAKPSIWKRVKGTVITLGIGAAAGYAIAR